MKKIVFLITAIFFISFSANAQKQEKKESRGEKIKALKIAFITEQLNLTSNEAQKFWPIYNKFDNKLYELERVEKFKLLVKIKKTGGIESVSENEAKSIMEKVTTLDKQIFNTKLEYDKELAKVLSFKKILKLKIAEKDFIRNLMRKYRKKKEGFKKQKQ